MRACGLQAAAYMAARNDEGMRYAAQVGVNCYARVRLSFLNKEVSFSHFRLHFFIRHHVPMTSLVS